MAKKEKKDNNKQKRHYFKDMKAELKKVSWPTFKQLVNNTTAVIVIVLITAAIVFVLDLAFETVNKYGVEKLKAIVTSSSSDESGVSEQNVEEQENVTSSEDNSTEENKLEETNSVTEENTVSETENTVEQ